jgi:SAM-dependent methyltransferase
MRNQDRWVPSKFIYQNGKLIGSRDPNEVAIGDRLFADLVAGLYETHLQRYARGRLIDLGCGSVPLYAAYSEYVTEAICVDWGNTSHESNHLDYECDLTQKLPFRDCEFDTILLSDVLEHIPEPEGLWQEMSRILSPGGTLLLNVPFFFRLHEEPYDYYRYTEHALRRFATRNGFEVLVLRPVGGTPEILADLLGKHLRFIPLVGDTLVMATHALTRAFLKTSPGRQMSEKTGQMFPLGYFLVARKTTLES